MTAVQFRGVSSHYRSRDAAKVSFRYPVVGEAGFSAAKGDLIGLFPENAADLGKKLLLASVEDPSSHLLCDGGLYKTSSVVIDFRDANAGAMQCQFWYIGSKSGLVEGKSDTFTVCVDESEYPSISFGSMDDQALLSAVHSRNSFYTGGEEGGPKSDSSTLESSFILVSEGNSRNISGSEFASEYVMAQFDPPSSEQGCEQGEQGRSEVVSEKASGHNSSTIEASASTASDKAEDSSTATNNLVNGYVICPSLSETVCTPTETAVGSKEEIPCEEDTVMLQLDPPPDLSQLPPPPPPSTSEAKLSPEIEKIGKSEMDFVKIGDSIQPSSHSTTSAAGDAAASALLTPLLPPQLPAEMSSSTVIIEKHVTQREARSLKSSNRELRLKVHKLAEILEDKKARIASLTDTVLKQEARMQEPEKLGAEFERERQCWANSVATLKEKLLEQTKIEEELKHKLQSSKTKLLSIEGNRRMTESLNKKLLADKTALEEKVKQLIQENKTIFERSAKLLTQLQDSETKREVLKSEKQVLQGKIDYLHAELRKIKVGKEKKDEDEGVNGRRRQELVSGMQQQRRFGHTQEKQHGENMPRQQPAFGKSTATAVATHGELLIQQHSGSSAHVGKTSGTTECPRHHIPTPPLTSNATGNSRTDRNLLTTLPPPPSLTLTPAQLQGRPNQLPIQGASSPAPKPTTDAKRDPDPPRLTRSNWWQLREKEEGVARKRRSDEDYHFMPLLGLEYSSARAGEKGRGNGSTAYTTNKQPGTVELHQGARSKDSERRIKELEGQLTGGMADEGVVLVECPICGKKLHSRENDLSAALHVEYCLQRSEEQNKQ